MTVEVYRALDRNCLAVRAADTGGKLAGHEHSVWIRDATFVVEEELRQRMLDSGRENVHAYVRGEWLDDPPNVTGAVQFLKYHPHRTPYFYDPVRHEQVTHATAAHVTTRGVTAVQPENRSESPE